MTEKAFHIHFYGGKQWKIVHTGGKAFVVDSSYRGAEKPETNDKLDEYWRYECSDKTLWSLEGFQRRLRDILSTYGYTAEDFKNTIVFIYSNDDVIRGIEL